MSDAPRQSNKKTVKNRTPKKLSGAAANGPGPGRPKGSQNKVPKAIKEAALGALNAGEGAEAFFLRRKEEDPNAFMGFLKSIVPLDVHMGDPEGKPLVITIQPVKPRE